MKQSLLFLSFLILPLAMVAQQMNPKEKAKAVLEKVSKEYKKYNTIEADFQYIMENRKQEDFKEVEKGTIMLMGEKFRINFGNYLVICDNENVWTYLKEANEVQVNKYEPGEMKINPQKIFSLYKEGFLYGYKGRNKVNGKSLHTIELTPEDKDKSYYKVRLHVDPETHRIKRMKTFENDSSIFTYKIQNYQVNQEMSASSFQFKKSKHPDVTVVDLRK